MSANLKKFFNLDDVNFTQEGLEAPYENSTIDFYEKPYDSLTKPNLKSFKFIDESNDGFFVVQAENKNKAIDLVANDLCKNNSGLLHFKSEIEARNYISKSMIIIEITDSAVIISSYDLGNPYDPPIVTNMINEYLR